MSSSRSQSGRGWAFASVSSGLRAFSLCARVPAYPSYSTRVAETFWKRCRRRDGTGLRQLASARTTCASCHSSKAQDLPENDHPESKGHEAAPGPTMKVDADERELL